jgi:hypothetical protein
MLGVAASAPALPGQDALPDTTLGVAQAQPGPSLSPFQQAQQPPIPGWQQPGMNQYNLNQYNQGAQPQAWQMAGAPPTNSPAPNPYAAPGEGATSVNNWVQRGNTPPQPAWTGYPAGDKTSLGVPTGNAASPANVTPGHAQGEDNKKKGWFDTIREFFMH